MTSPSPARSLASTLFLLSRSERRPMWYSFIPLRGIKFHLWIKLPQAICGDNKKRSWRTFTGQTVILVCLEAFLEKAMPEIKIVTEVAGRICALPVEAGATIGNGDDIAFVE